LPTTNAPSLVVSAGPSYHPSSLLPSATSIPLASLFANPNSVSPVPATVEKPASESFNPSTDGPNIPSLDPSATTVVSDDKMEYQVDSSITTDGTDNAAVDGDEPLGNNESDPTSSAAIVGIVCGMLALSAVLVGLFVFYRKMRNKNEGGGVPDFVDFPNDSVHEEIRRGSADEFGSDG